MIIPFGFLKESTIDYSIVNLTYDSKSFDPSTQIGTALENLDMDPDGGYLFLSSSASIWRYTFTPDDISTASYDSNTQTIDQARTGLMVRESGVTLRYGNFGGNFYKRTLSPAYDLSTAGSSSSEAPTETDNERGWVMNRAGTKLYVLDANNRTIFQYSVSPAQNGTLTYDNKSLDISVATVNVKGLDISPDGKYIIFGDPNTDLLWQFEMTTPGDISTGTNSLSKDISSESGVMQAVKYNVLGDKIIVLDAGSDKLFQYSI